MEDSKIIKKLYVLGVVTITLLILGDFFRRVALFFDFSFDRYTLVSKVLILMSYVIFFLLNFRFYFSNLITRQIIRLILVLFGLYFLSNFALPFFRKRYISYPNIEYFLRYIYFPVTLLIFYNFFKSKYFLKKLYNILETFFLINAVLIIIAFFFDIDVFKSYPNPLRFGYSGLFNRPNYLSYFTVLMIFVLHYKTFFTRENKAWVKFILVLFAALFSGTKRIYFSIIILIILHAYWFRKEIKIKTFVLLACIISLVIYFKQYLIDYLMVKFDLLIHIYYKLGLVSMILSYRDLRLIDTIEGHIMPNYTFANYFIGGADFSIIRPEMTLFDVFLFFGAIGFFVYFLLIKIFWKSLENVNFYLKSLLIIIAVTASLSSGFLISVNIPLIFFICVFSLMYEYEENKRLNQKI